MKKNSGITLVTLIITIIILLVLATVSINLIMNGDLIGKAKTAVDKYSDGEIEEQIELAYSEWQMGKYLGEIKTATEFMQEKLEITLGDNGLIVTENEGTILVTLSNNKLYEYNVTTGKTEKTDVISKSNKKEDSYVGCYADIDKDGIVDGVIFVDLLTGSVRDTQQWINANGAYTFPTDVKVENVNNYYISQSNYTDSHFGTHEVISPKTTNGKQRFYVMALSDFTTPAKTDGTEEENYPAYTSYYWYKNAIGNMNSLITSSNDFGTGNENTRKMIEKWNAAGEEDPEVEPYTDSPQDKRDIWKHIQTIYNDGKGWFLPSRAEWAAFANEIGDDIQISKSNHNSKYGLSGVYWTSTQNNVGNKNWAWRMLFSFPGILNNGSVNETYAVRLATTF